MERYNCTPQEQWVLEQGEKGEIADLKEEFGEPEENRRLRARFLEALLTDEITVGTERFKPHRRGILITQAMVGEPLDLQNAEVYHTVCLERCIFKEKVTFREARFARHLHLNDCMFPQEADFHRLNVALDLSCAEAIFQGPVDFGGADIGGQFRACGAQFARAIFDNATFQGLVDLRFTSFHELQFINVNYVTVILEGMTYQHIISGPGIGKFC
jgi:uncharacterized protein YjbI with pentapeptide repeats